MNKVKILPYLTLLITLSSVLPWSTLKIGNTTFWWIVEAFILFLLFISRSKSYRVWPINAFLLMVLISAIYGATIQAENYWDWKELVSNFMIFSLAMSVYVYDPPQVLTQTLHVWFKWAWLLFIVIAFSLESDGFGNYFVPYVFAALFWPELNNKQKLLMVVAFLITFFLGYESRSGVVRFTVAILLGSLLLFDMFKRKIAALSKLLYILLLFSPIVLFALGITGTFNIFSIGEEFGIEDKYTVKDEFGNEVSRVADTRTFIYLEEIKSAIKYNYVIQGRSIARGYESSFFADMNVGSESDNAASLRFGERQSCEVSILNIFNYFGIIGVIVYFLIFARAAYLAVWRSNNKYMRLVGIFVAFRWMYAWVEDFTNFGLNYFFLWILIGMCYSPHFREMNDYKFYSWLRKSIR